MDFCGLVSFLGTSPFWSCKILFLDRFIGFTYAAPVASKICILPPAVEDLLPNFGAFWSIARRLNQSPCPRKSQLFSQAKVMALLGTLCLCTICVCAEWFRGLSIGISVQDFSMSYLGLVVSRDLIWLRSSIVLLLALALKSSSSFLFFFSDYIFAFGK